MKLMYQSNWPLTLALLTTVMLSACGGSGGGSTVTTSNPTSTIPATTDTTPPTLATASIVAPANGETNVPKTATISFRASEALSSAKVILTCGGTVVPTITSFLLDTVTVTPSQNLAYATSCTASVDSTQTKDTAGNKFVSNVVITNFTVEKAPVLGDTVPPTLVAVISPLSGSVGVSLSPTLSFRASEPLGSAKIILTCGGTVIPTNTAIASDIVTAAPLQNLAYGSACTASIDSAQTKDMAGNKFGTNVVITSFTVEQAPIVVIPKDIVQPTLATTSNIISPANGVKGVSLSPTISFRASEPLSSAKVILTCGGTVMPSATSFVSDLVTAAPTQNLIYGSFCTATVDSTATKDLAGNKFGSNVVITSFTVEQAPVVVVVPAGDTTPPTLAGTVFPPNSSLHQALDTKIVFSVSEPLSAIKTMMTCGVNSLPIDVSSWSTSTSVTVTPKSPLPASSSCTLLIDRDGSTDLAGNKFTQNWLVTKFTTADAPVVVIPPVVVVPTGDKIPPVYLGGVFPAMGAVGVSPDTEINFDMSEVLGSARVTYSCVSSTGVVRAGYSIASVVALSSSRVKTKIEYPITMGDTCTVTLQKSGTRDLANNYLVADVVLTKFTVVTKATQASACDQTVPRTSPPMFNGTQLVEVCNGVFADPATDPADYGDIGLTRTFANAAIKKFFGEIKNPVAPDIIACVTTTCNVYFMDAGPGGRIMPQGMSTQNRSFTATRDTFVIGSTYAGFNRLLVSAHELTHLEIIARIGNGRIPTWFNEGLATYIGGSPTCALFTPGVTTPLKVQANLKDQTQWVIDAAHYCQGSDEITSWIAKNGKPALIQLLDKVKNGAEFYSVYGSLIN